MCATLEYYLTATSRSAHVFWENLTAALFLFFWKSSYFSVVLNICMFFKCQNLKNGFGSDSQPNEALTMEIFKHMCTLCMYSVCDINNHCGIFKNIFRLCFMLLKSVKLSVHKQFQLGKLVLILIRFLMHSIFKPK